MKRIGGAFGLLAQQLARVANEMREQRESQERCAEAIASSVRLLTEALDEHAETVAAAISPPRVVPPELPEEDVAQVSRTLTQIQQAIFGNEPPNPELFPNTLTIKGGHPMRDLQRLMLGVEGES